ncbi:hypothetical protein B0A55_03372 [Friedmanniomyces simplex]|uniref:Uncharacterized protein n=1 Tax=Friedmanniomyces simplex TaxID=329884 RepID=A0A4U0XUY2_9PEZI|nr:hypothetical protein B0A55_03372 [Friedmanniomyces simplex]
MARISAMKTPQRPTVDDADLLPGEEDVTHGAGSVDDSDLLRTGKPDEDSARHKQDQYRAHDDPECTIAHLGSDLPDPSPQKSDLGTSDRPGRGTGSIAQRSPTQRLVHTPASPMRANGSRDGTNAAVSTISGEAQASKALGRSNGKLKRPSTGRANPPYRNPAERKPVAVRRMHGGHQARPDTYALDDSPGKLTPQLRAKRVEHAQVISPTKKQKKAALSKEAQDAIIPQLGAALAATPHASLVPPEQEPVASSPRRSTRRIGAADQALDQAQAGATESGSTQDTRYKDYFRDKRTSSAKEAAPALQSQEIEESAEEPEDEEILEARLGADYDTLAKQADTAIEQAPPPPTPPSKPCDSLGKTAPMSMTHRVVEAVVIPAQETMPPGSAQKRASPSPPYSQPEVPPSTESIADERAQERKQRRKVWLDAKARREKQVKEVAGVKAGRRSAGKRQKQDMHKEGEYERNHDGKYGEQAELGGSREDEEDAHEADQDGEGVDGICHPPVQIAKPVNVRPSELEFCCTGESHSDSEPSSGQSSATRKRPRSSAKVRPAASKPQKRRSRGLVAETTPADIREVITDADKVRLYGQWQDLRAVCKALQNIGVQTLKRDRQPQWKILLKDDKIIAAIDTCKNALAKVVDGEDPSPDLNDAAKQIRALYDRSNGNRLEFDNTVRIKNIYFHLFPCLVRMIQDMLLHYEKSDVGLEPGSPLTTEHLGLVRAMISVVLDLFQGAKQYDQPPSHFALVGPVRNGIVAPLKLIYKNFTRAHCELRRAAEHKRERQLDAERNALAAQREEQEARRAEQSKRIKKKWQQLHFERVCAEGGIMSRQKRDHLCCVPLPEAEYDENGQAFERVEVFHPRIGPSPAAVERARALVWPMECSMALADGLKQYAGPDVFEKVFRRYCGRGRVLHAFNVTEIVTCAADMKEWLLQQEGGVEEWMQKIPVWTKGHPLGKENEGSHEQEDEGFDE